MRTLNLQCIYLFTTHHSTMIMTEPSMNRPLDKKGFFGSHAVDLKKNFVDTTNIEKTLYTMQLLWYVIFQN